MNEVTEARARVLDAVIPYGRKVGLVWRSLYVLLQCGRYDGLFTISQVQRAIRYGNSRFAWSWADLMDKGLLLVIPAGSGSQVYYQLSVKGKDLLEELNEVYLSDPE